MGKPLVVLGGKSLYNYDTESIKENTDKSDYKKYIYIQNFHIAQHTVNKQKTNWGKYLQLTLQRTNFPQT